MASNIEAACGRQRPVLLLTRYVACNPRYLQSVRMKNMKAVVPLCKAAHQQVCGTADTVCLHEKYHAHPDLDK